LRDAFKTALKERGLGPLVRANQSGCLEQCEVGPTVVIYPQGIWYGRVSLEDVPRIVEETIVHGRILDDLLIPDALLNCRGLASRATKEPGRPFTVPAES
jgi:(2Fe-2S) ferredoxin